jgi:hypothetical protein
VEDIMKRIPTPQATWLVVALALAGCSSDETPVSGGGGWNQDSGEISGTMASQPDLVDDGQMESPEEQSLDGGPEGALAAIRPLRFWRHINNVERRFEFAFADSDSTGRPTTAIVTVHKYFQGTFNIAGVSVDGGVSDTTRLLVRKPFVDHWVRRVLLKRVPHPTAVDLASRRPMWRIAATTGVRVHSERPPVDAHVSIRSLRIQSGDLDTTITSTREFFRLRQILKLEAGAEVAVTVTTDQPDDVVVLLRPGLRVRFHANGDNTYSARFQLPSDRTLGVRHFGVNALDRETLYDDRAPYNSQAWIFPYVLANELMAEYRP